MSTTTEQNVTCDNLTYEDMVIPSSNTGELIVGSSNDGTMTQLSVAGATNDQVLVANSGATNGVDWENNEGGTGSGGANTSTVIVTGVDMAAGVAYTRFNPLLSTGGGLDALPIPFDANIHRLIYIVGEGDVWEANTFSINFFKADNSTNARTRIETTTTDDDFLWDNDGGYFWGVYQSSVAAADFINTSKAIVQDVNGRTGWNVSAGERIVVERNVTTVTNSIVVTVIMIFQSTNFT